MGVALVLLVDGCVLAFSVRIWHTCADAGTGAELGAGAGTSLHDASTADGGSRFQSGIDDDADAGHGVALGGVADVVDGDDPSSAAMPTDKWHPRTVDALRSLDVALRVKVRIRGTVHTHTHTHTHIIRPRHSLPSMRLT